MVSAKTVKSADSAGGDASSQTLQNHGGWISEELSAVPLKPFNTGLVNALPRVRELIARSVIHPADFSHEKYNGCEIIP